MDTRIFKYSYLIVATSLIGIESIAQNLRADHLIAELINSGKDSSRVELLLEISEVLVNDYPHEAFKYANEGLKLSNQLNSPFLAAASHNRIGKAYWSRGDLAKAFEELIYQLKWLKSLITESYGLIICWR